MKRILKWGAGLGMTVLVSCSPQNPQRATYELGNSYQDSKAKLIRYHQSQNRSFNLFRDALNSSYAEVSPGRESRFSVVRSAPDIGRVVMHEAVLRAKGNGAVLQAVSPLDRKVAYDVPRALTGDKLGGLRDLDTWVTSNLKVKSRILDEERP